MLPDDAVRLFLQGSWDRRQLDRFARPLYARPSGYSVPHSYIGSERRVTACIQCRSLLVGCSGERDGETIAGLLDGEMAPDVHWPCRFEMALVSRFSRLNRHLLLTFLQ